MELLVISNCAALPYERIFSSILPQYNVSSLHVSKLEQSDLNFSLYEKIVCISSHVDMLERRLRDSSPIIEIPNFFFSGYHPDTVYASDSEGKQVMSPVGAYHSAIAITAYKNGLSSREALELYTGETYEAIGYLDEFSKSADEFLTTHKKAGLPIDHLFRKWARSGCFMHTFNHPHNFCFVDIAKEVCKRNFSEFYDINYTFPDMLSGNTIFPCYPEIAERRGTVGSYLFKISQQFRCVDLEKFITQSFLLYEAIGREHLYVARPFNRQYLTISNHLSER